MEKIEHSEAPRKLPSLAKAYWLYNVVGNIAIAIMANGWFGTQVPLGLFIAWFAFNGYCLFLIWHAAREYTGRPLWRGLAQAVVILGGALSAVFAVNLLGQLGDRLQNLEPGKKGESITTQLFGYRPLQASLSPLPNSIREPIPKPIHLVSKGESLAEIARQYAVPVRALAESNGVGLGASIHTGQSLVIPALNGLEARKEQLLEAASKVNRGAPVVIGGGIRLDGASVEPDLTFAYKYTYINGRLTAQNEDRMRAALNLETRPLIKGYVCASAETAWLRYMARTMRFNYYDALGAYIGTIDIPTSECFA